MSDAAWEQARSRASVIGSLAARGTTGIATSDRQPGHFIITQRNEGNDDYLNPETELEPDPPRDPDHLHMDHDAPPGQPARRNVYGLPEHFPQRSRTIRDIAAVHVDHRPGRILSTIRHGQRDPRRADDDCLLAVTPDPLVGPGQPRHDRGSKG